MSVARRAGGGAASACVQYATRRRWVRWAAAARASRSCWAAEATRQCWAAAARANHNNAISSGPIITRVAKRSIPATTRTTANPHAVNISHKNIRSPPPLAVGTGPMACFLKSHFQRELNPFASTSVRPARASHISTHRSALLTNAQSMSRVPDLLIREKQEQKQYIAAAKWFALVGFG